MRKPKDMLIYYGWLNSFNSGKNSWDNEKVAQDLSKYNLFVFGNGLQDPSHGDFANTQVIIPRIKALNPDAKIFGYVTVNQDYSAFTPKVDQWNILGVNGIFLDEAGYDYGKTRADFNQRVDYVHSMAVSKLCMANSWNTDHVLGTVNDPNFPNTTYNPSSVSSNLTNSDWVLLESFPVNTAAWTPGYENASDWKIRGDKVLTLRTQFGVKYASVCVIDNGTADGQKMSDFAYASALMYDIEAFGTSDSSYGSSSAAVRYWQRPGAVSAIPATVQQDPSNSSIYHRYAGDEHASLNFTTNQQSSSVENGVMAYGSLYAANLGTSMAISATPVKFTLLPTAGLYKNVAVDASLNKITVQVKGIYDVKFSVCASVQTAGNVQFHLRKNGSELTEFGTKVKLTTTLLLAGFSNLGDFSPGDVLEIYVDGNSTNLTVWDAQLTVKKM